MDSNCPALSSSKQFRTISSIERTGAGRFDVLVCLFVLTSVVITYTCMYTGYIKNIILYIISIMHKIFLVSVSKKTNNETVFLFMKIN